MGGYAKSLAVTDGDGSQMLRGRKSYQMGMDTTGAVMDGDGLISHYRAGLYSETKIASDVYYIIIIGHLAEKS